jgi:hypothetical protein
VKASKIMLIYLKGHIKIPWQSLAAKTQSGTITFFASHGATETYADFHIGHHAVEGLVFP